MLFTASKPRLEGARLGGAGPRPALAWSSLPTTMHDLSRATRVCKATPQAMLPWVLVHGHLLHMAALVPEHAQQMVPPPQQAASMPAGVSACWPTAAQLMGCSCSCILVMPVQSNRAVTLTQNFVPARAHLCCEADRCRARGSPAWLGQSAKPPAPGMPAPCP